MVKKDINLGRALLLASCLVGPAAEAQADQLLIYNFSDYFAPDTISKFIEKTTIDARVDSARDLGFPPATAFLKVALPNILPALASAWLLREDQKLRCAGIDDDLAAPQLQPSCIADPRSELPAFLMCCSNFS